MRPERTILALAMLAGLAGCYPYTQASYSLPKGFQVYGYGLNLNNEVFGFYYGSPQYVSQREYYHPTFALGLRWSPARGEK